MDELKKFLDFVFKYYEPDSNHLRLEQQALNEFKKLHPQADESVCKIVGQVRLTKHNILSSLIVVFTYIDKELFTKKSILSLKIHDHLEILVKPGLKINGEKIPFDLLYELLNFEKKCSDLLRSSKKKLKDLDDMQSDIGQRKPSDMTRVYPKEVNETHPTLPYPVQDKFQEVAEKASSQLDSRISRGIGFNFDAHLAPFDKNSKAQAHFQNIHYDDSFSDSDQYEKKTSSSVFESVSHNAKEALSNKSFPNQNISVGKNDAIFVESKSLSKKGSLNDAIFLYQTDEMNNKSQTDFLESINKSLVTNSLWGRDYKSEFVPVQSRTLDENYRMDPSVRDKINGKMFEKLRNQSFS
ncbi:hypothetical protein BpHYR1_051985 [Brachionus plicatilis]|uniref:Uncharacterized protein n=1 Tax=Brachionus plicatilis TaxID=10195 RepID=A0A3M7R7X0_BRAPC|nr:hypothetical protein BpHYR1_051985 [Brachionus plicatilis]